jgi:hypothetical protein
MMITLTLTPPTTTRAAPSPRLVTLTPAPVMKVLTLNLPATPLLRTVPQHP